MKKLMLLMMVSILCIGLTSCGSKGFTQKSKNIEINSTTDIMTLLDIEEGYTATINEENLDRTKVGLYTIKVTLDKEGKKNDYDIEIQVVDTTKPEVKVEPAKVKLNAVDYNLASFVTVSDNSNEEIVPVFDTTTLDTSKSGTYDVKYTVADSSGNESVGTLTVLVQAYQTTYTLTEMSEKIRKIIDEKYSHVLKYTVNQYTDELAIHFVDDSSSITEFDEKLKFFTYATPYIKVAEYNGKGQIILGTTFIYASINSFDYYRSATPLIALTPSGLKYTFNMLPSKTEYDEGVYSSRWYYLFNKIDDKYTDENLDTIYKLFKEGKITYMINKANSKGVRPEGAYGDNYINAVITMLDFYKDVEEQLDWKPSANE